MYNYNVINKLIDNKQQEKKSITIGEMASSMGLSLGSLNNIKSGINIPKADTLEIIAKYFGVDMNYFFTDDSKHGKITSVVSAPVEVYEPPAELAQCYKIMFEQQKEITDLTREVERLKNGHASMNGAKAG